MSRVRSARGRSHGVLIVSERPPERLNASNVFLRVEWALTACGIWLKAHFQLDFMADDPPTCLR